MLTSILWTSTALLLPASSQEALSCYYCRLQSLHEPCPNLTVQCWSHQRCLTSTGYYGRVPNLCGLGCVDAQLCGSQQVVSYRGVKHSVKLNCCCRNNCNKQQDGTSAQKTMVKETLKGAPHSMEDDDSCANYTLAQTSSTPTTSGT